MPDRRGLGGLALASGPRLADLLLERQIGTHPRVQSPTPHPGPRLPAAFPTASEEKLTTPCGFRKVFISRGSEGDEKKKSQTRFVRRSAHLPLPRAGARQRVSKTGIGSASPSRTIRRSGRSAPG
ncbi:pr27.1 [rat cytomegalovirus strain Maastricht]|uniref:Pr27.1 n=1 Tax=Rat cytomegalovirus (strain Maastricht) TaxID=79700 RepID=Q9DWG1_RCMVM|nr:pr27.1 [rat cytomegalovirus strain Maastricht]AAF99128.1 pr27.1 [rat cytomegalovirus strain Maastricht]